MSIVQAFVAGCVFVAMICFGALFFWHVMRAFAGRYGQDHDAPVPLGPLFTSGGGALIAASVLQIILAAQSY